MKGKFIFSMASAILMLIAATGVDYNYPVLSASSSSRESPVLITTPTSPVESIRMSLANGSYTIRVRDRNLLKEMREEYAGGELILKRIAVLNQTEGKVISIGKNFSSGEMVGSTWTMPPKAYADNKNSFGESLLKDVIEDLHAGKWINKGQQIMDGKKVARIESDREDSREVAYIDAATGNPVRREIYQKHNQGIGDQTVEQVEEYDYYTAMPADFFDTPGVSVKEGPAPIQKDIAG